MKKVYTDELIFRALGDRHRLAILRHLLEREMNAGEILAVVDVVQSTLSHHMKILTSSGLVNSRRAGKCTYYTINTKAVEFVMEKLKLFLDPAVPAGEIPEESPAPLKEKPEKKQPKPPEDEPEEPKAKEPEKEHEVIATPITYDEPVREKEKARGKKEKNKAKGKGKEKNKGGKKKK